MESVSRSPIYTHFGETITGAHGDEDGEDDYDDTDDSYGNDDNGDDTMIMKTMPGAPTIRAFNRAEDFITENEVSFIMLIMMMVMTIFMMMMMLIMMLIMVKIMTCL